MLGNLVGKVLTKWEKYAHNGKQWEKVVKRRSYNGN
jgi:hypothetical protein